MPDSTSPLYWSVAELIAAYQSRELSPVEVVEEALQRIDSFDPELKAFLGRCDALAREQASLAEQAYRAGDAAPLCGIPVSIKDTFHIKDHVTTFGSLAFKDNLSTHDSGVVRRLRQAGAVFTGKTNTSEFAQSATTENRFFDDCHNPWDTSRTTGGSSGGAAASVAAGLSSLAVGADGGGSIRIPASFSGVFGIKPGYGLCQDEDGLSAMSDFISPGPFSNCVADARIMLSVLADTQYVRQSTKKKLRIAWSKRPGNRPHDPDILKVCERAVQHLVELGHEVEEIELHIDGWEEAFAPLVLHNEFRERDYLLDEAIDLLTGYERRSLEAAREVSSEALEAGQVAHKAYRQRMIDLFEQYDFIVTPTTSVTAFPVGQRPDVIGGEDVHWLWGSFPCTAPFNVSGHPAASIPCGFSNSLPVGLQIVAPFMADGALLDICEDLEELIQFDNSRMKEIWSSPHDALKTA